ncbi:MAG: hydrogenase maturation nickel metallochaperone HypA [Nitrospirae bacterium]|nr:hydrogenase maturation nickel metallochaperone HypA [Nitrospirota bacterium]
MHEFSLARDLVRLAERRLPAEGPRRVRRVTVRLGTFAGIGPESLTTAFELASAGTPFEGATLKIEPAEGSDLMLVALEVGE